MESETVGKIFSESIFNGLWQGFKMVWWLLPLGIIIKILEKRVNKKIDNWKRKRK